MLPYGLIRRKDCQIADTVQHRPVRKLEDEAALFHTK